MTVGKIAIKIAINIVTTPAKNIAGEKIERLEAVRFSPLGKGIRSG
jgi:hypothetical protein